MKKWNAFQNAFVNSCRVSNGPLNFFFQGSRKARAKSDVPGDVQSGHLGRSSISGILRRKRRQ